MYKLLKNKQTNFKKLEAEESIIICLMNEGMVMPRGGGGGMDALASLELHQLLISDNRPCPNKSKTTRFFITDIVLITYEV